jgi:O-antigen/teichoic acid export membrane protein
MTASVSQDVYRRGLVFTTVGSVSSLVLLFVELLIVARLLPPDTYGIYILLLTSANLLVMVIDFGCRASVTRLISGALGAEARQQAIVSSALSFRAAVAVGSAAILWLISVLLSLFAPASDLARYVGFLPLMVVAASFDELLFGMLQGFHAYRSIATAQLVRAVLRLLLTISLLVTFHAGITALVLSWSISFALICVYEYRALPVRKFWGWHRTTVVEMLRFGFPLQISRCFTIVCTRLHPALLGIFGGPASTAYFAVANRIPEALQTLSDSYFRVYFPTMTTMLSAGQKDDAKILFERSLRLVSFSVALAAIVSIVFSYEVVTLLFSSKYTSSVPVFALLMIALHMTVMVSVFGNTLLAAGRSGRSLTVDTVWLAVSAAGSLLLVPGFGAVGAAIAAVLGSYACIPVAAWMVRRSKLRIAPAVYVKQTVILLVCVALGWWVQTLGVATGSITGLACKTAIIAFFVVTSWLSAAITRDDIGLILGRFARNQNSRMASVSPLQRAAVK